MPGKMRRHRQRKDARLRMGLRELDSVGLMGWSIGDGLGGFFYALLLRLLRLRLLGACIKLVIMCYFLSPACKASIYVGTLRLLKVKA